MRTAPATAPRHVSAATPPGLHHVAAVFLRVASWITLLVVMLLVAFDFDGPGGRTADWLFGIPSLVRVAAWVLYGVRGTWLSWLGVLVDLAMASVAFDWFDWRGSDKGRLLLASLVCSSAIPFWWLATGRRLGALFGAGGMLFGLAALGALELEIREDLLLVGLIVMSILGSWGADGAVLLWGLQHWRAQNLEEDVEPR